MDMDCYHYSLPFLQSYSLNRLPSGYIQLGAAQSRHQNLLVIIISCNNVVENGSFEWRSPHCTNEG